MVSSYPKSPDHLWYGAEGSCYPALGRCVRCSTPPTTLGGPHGALSDRAALASALSSRAASLLSGVCPLTPTANAGCVPMTHVPEISHLRNMLAIRSQRRSITLRWPYI
jgi:hypothetical protein